MSEFVVLNNPGSLPVPPSELLARVSQADVANYFRVKSVGALKAVIPGLTESFRVCAEKAGQATDAQYQRLALQVCDIVSAHPVIASLGVKVLPEAGAMHLNMGAGSLFWSEISRFDAHISDHFSVGAARSTSPRSKATIPVHSWYALSQGSGFRSKNPVRYEGYARFEIEFGDQTDLDMEQPPQEVVVSSGRVVVCIPEAQMPVWHSEEVEPMLQEWRALNKEHNRVLEEIKRLEAPGVVEALMTEHALAQAGVNLADLEARIRGLGVLT